MISFLVVKIFSVARLGWNKTFPHPIFFKRRPHLLFARLLSPSVPVFWAMTVEVPLGTHAAKGGLRRSGVASRPSVDIGRSSPSAAYPDRKRPLDLDCLLKVMRGRWNGRPDV
jgi:hypothetical protein